MRGVLKWLVFTASLIASTANATTVTSNVNCRAQPTPRAAVVAKITAGTDVSVEQRRDAWSLIRHAPRNCWVVSRYLGEQTTADANRESLSQTRAASQRARTNSVRVSRPSRHSSFWTSPPHRSPRRQSRARRAPNYNYGGGTCPCSGRNICVGPRGGRYCITSGGNKRYGI